MSKSGIPTDWKNCATCNKWLGRVIPNAPCTFVEYDMDERARCVGGVFNGADMPGSQSCGKWEQRFKKRI